MYIAIDLKRMAIVYRCEKVETVRALINIELVHVATAILEENDITAYERFSVRELQKLFEGLTGGSNPNSHNANYLVGQILCLCQTIPPMQVDAFEVVVQSMQLKPHDKDFYRYAKGKSRAENLEEAYDPPPLLGNWKAAQALALGTAPAQAVAPVQAQPWAVAPTTTPPKYAPPWA